jgi:hypothetical protein
LGQKKEFIEAVYFNGTKGFRSISETAKQANILAKPDGIRITQADVRKWKERERETQEEAAPGIQLIHSQWSISRVSD